MDQDIFQNQYGGLDPTGQTSMAPSQEDVQKRQEQEMIRRLMAQSENANKNIGTLEEKLKFDPIDSAHKRWKDHYKWKGVSTGRKLGSIGYGVLDALSNFGSKNAMDKIREQEQQRFDNLKSTVPDMINTQKGLVTNANNVIERMNQDRMKKESNLAQIELKKLLDSTSNPMEFARIKDMAERAEREGTLTKEKVKLMGSQKNLVDQKTKTEEETRFLKNPIGAATGLGKMTPEGKTEWLGNYEAINKALAKARPERQFAPRIMPDGGTQFELTVNPVTQEVESKQVTPRTAYQITPNSVTPIQQPDGMTGPNSTKARLTPAEFKIFSDMDKTAKLLRSTSATMLNDISKGDIDVYSGFNDSHFGRLLNGLFQDDPRIAAAWSQGPQMGSIATLQHLKAMYGGRAPQALAQDLDQLISGKMANGIGKASAIMSQQLIAEMYTMQQAKDPRATKLFADPNFYGFLKDKMADTIKKAQRAGQLKLPVPPVENVGELMNKYLEKNQPQQTTPVYVKPPNVFFNEGMKLQKKVK